MRIALLIDSLGGGGAERQFVELANGLASRKHQILVLYYHKDEFYRDKLNQSDILVKRLSPRNLLQKVQFVRRELVSFNPDIVQAFLSKPSAIAILASIAKPWRVVVSERLLSIKRRKELRFRVIRQLFRAADWIVSNSEANRQLILKDDSFLGYKTSTIINCVDLDYFTPASTLSKNNKFRFIVVASVTQVKNAFNLTKALALVSESYKDSFELIWVGRKNDNKSDSHYHDLCNLIKSLNLENTIRFEDPVKDIVSWLQKADTFILVSLREGCPNALLEAMSCGLPVIASSISDIPTFITDKENGFLCDPKDSQSIADSIVTMLKLSNEQRIQMGRKARLSAENLFSRERYISEYEDLYYNLLTKAAPSIKISEIISES